MIPIGFRILVLGFCLIQAMALHAFSQDLDPSVFQPFPSKTQQLDNRTALEPSVLEPTIAGNNRTAGTINKDVENELETAKSEPLPGLKDEFQQAYQNVQSILLPNDRPEKRLDSAIEEGAVRGSNSIQGAVPGVIKNGKTAVESPLEFVPAPNQSVTGETGTRIASRAVSGVAISEGSQPAGSHFTPEIPDNLLNEADELPHETANLAEGSSESPISNHPLVWWKEFVKQSLHPNNEGHFVEPNMLVYLALKNSPRIQAISQNPLIREAQVVEADSVFDPVGFVKSNFNDRHDPVGNTLVTGGPAFLDDHIWSGDAGIRKKTRTGARVELGQKLGFQNSNSRFFLPQDQGTSTLALNVTQPLLRGRGRYINQSQILIAQTNGQAAWATFENELQDELQLVAQAYWRLYYDRTLFLQKKRSVQRAIDILRILEGRSEFDSLPSQIARAKSAVATRRTDLANALRDVRNSETEIRRRVAEKDWAAVQKIELLPDELPSAETTDIPLEHIVKTALENRREIKEAMHRAKAAAIQQQISVNDLLPELSLLIGGYVSALNPESGVLQSWGDQFGNRPGYNAGIQFEMPYGNRAAQSQLTQKKHQLIRIKAEIEEQIQRVIAESQMSWRRIESALATRESALVAIEAADADLTQQTRRWENFGLAEGDMMDGQNATLLLNQVLDAQERLSAAELIYAQSELELKTAEIGLNRSMGTLLMHLNAPQARNTQASEEPMALPAESFN